MQKLAKTKKSTARQNVVRILMASNEENELPIDDDPVFQEMRREIVDFLDILQNLFQRLERLEELLEENDSGYDSNDPPSIT
ncbi:unnamed protein product [Hermetia illucens]|uniref:Uncharacterized protein n=1 Tax=Hermetia illucens TaxID=343691 RepID=A0A7R8UA87_HERIL|nr:unnamed protein product [Hermetia illucens]